MQNGHPILCSITFTRWAFVDLLEPERHFTTRAGRLRIDAVPGRGARILVLR